MTGKIMAQLLTKEWGQYWIQRRINGECNLPIGISSTRAHITDIRSIWGSLLATLRPSNDPVKLSRDNSPVQTMKAPTTKAADPA